MQEQCTAGASFMDARNCPVWGDKPGSDSHTKCLPHRYPPHMAVMPNMTDSAGGLTRPPHSSSTFSLVQSIRCTRTIRRASLACLLRFTIRSEEHTSELQS